MKKYDERLERIEKNTSDMKECIDAMQNNIAEMREENRKERELLHQATENLTEMKFLIGKLIKNYNRPA